MLCYFFFFCFFLGSGTKMKNLAIVSCMVLVFSISTSMAFGYVQFYAAFKKTYVKENSPEEFKTLVTKTKCAICHDSTKKTQTGKTDKKFRNPYGTALDTLLGKEDKKDKEKIYKIGRRMALSNYLTIKYNKIL